MLGHRMEKVSFDYKVARVRPGQEPKVSSMTPFSLPTLLPPSY